MSKKKKTKKRSAKDASKPSQAERHFEDAAYPYDQKLKRKEYEKTLVGLQIELLKLQRWVKERGERVVIFFEGRDAAGKGGTIKRFTEHLNPRGARVIALPKPNDTEKGQWYFQRYLGHFPTAGEIVFFDRSWYNRAGVEPVMGYCTPSQYVEFIKQVPEVERNLVDDGIRFFKLWFAIDQQEQARRFESRRTDPLKHWKLSPTDIASIKRWDDYTVARDRMFFLTHTKHAPWTVVRSDDKKKARINAIRFVLHSVPYDEKNPKIVARPDPVIVASASAITTDDNVRFTFDRA